MEHFPVNRPKAVWEILVPTVRQDGRPFRLKYHRVWDAKVAEIAGGLSIQSPIKGAWIAPNSETIRERMIPVRIVATEEQIRRIVDMTLKYYEQQAILAYKIGTNVILKESNDI